MATERTDNGPRNIFGWSLEEIEKELGELLDHKYRARQIYRALYERRVRSFAEMTDLSRSLRQRLGEHLEIRLPEASAKHLSKDGTVKYLFSLSDGATIETVDIPEENRRTLCLSSQAGCALACKFCVTGYWGGGRNLTAGEILAQVFRLCEEISADKRSLPQNLNLVFMGMGEPLLNMSGLRTSIEILLEQVSWKRVTVSTAGIIPGIEEMASWPRRPRLAISLHAPDDARRSAIMPINQRYPLADLLKTLERFPLASKERLTFEYIMIDGFNDSLEDADALARCLRGVRAKVNLIPMNPDAVLENLRPSSTATVEAFRRQLLQHDLLATTRRRRGDDVSAACGQLRAPHREPRRFRRSALSL